MKKLSLILLVFIGFCFAACEHSNGSHDVVKGKWTTQHYSMSSSAIMDEPMWIYVFNGKGHYKFINYNPDAIITKGTYELDGKTLHVYYNTADAEGVITMNENIFELDDATNPTKLTTRVYDSFGQMVMTVELGKAK